MYAVIETGGKQFKVEEGKEISIERIEAPKDGKVTFEQVLLVVDGDNMTVGKPFIENAKVQGSFVSEVKGKKIIAFKFKRRKDSKKKKGHRQLYSRVKIERIIK